MRPADAVRIRWEGLGLAVFLVLSGCAMPDFSGSASMRVEVEVYKGPLSKEPMAQWADLIGLFEEAETALIGINRVTVAFAVNQGFVDFPSYVKEPDKNSLVGSKDAITLAELFNETYENRFKVWCKNEDPDGLISQIDFFNCHVLVTLFADAKELFHEVQIIRRLADVVNRQVFPVCSKAEALLQDLCFEAEEKDSPNKWAADPKKNKLNADPKKNVRAVLVEFTRVAARFRAKSFRMAEAMVAGQTTTTKIRIAITNLIAHVADLGNQMQSQADTLLKQIDGQDRRELPLSAYLRDAEPTDFVQLYDWYDATAHDAIFPAPFLAPFFLPGTKVSQVKAYQRLYADHHWAKINTVHASGRGDVSMALIKDDIGNWNLKAFDNNPEELLKAYRDVAMAALDKAAKLATGGQSEVVDILLGVANTVSFGGAETDPANIGGVSLNALHQSTDKKLLEVASEFAEADKKKVEAYDATKTAFDETNKKIEDAKAELKSKSKLSPDVEPSPNQKQKETELKGLEKTLGEHETALQKARKDLIEHRNAALARFGEVLRNYGEMVDLLTEAAATE